MGQDKLGIKMNKKEYISPQTTLYLHPPALPSKCQVSSIYLRCPLLAVLFISSRVSIFLIISNLDQQHTKLSSQQHFLPTPPFSPDPTHNIPKPAEGPRVQPHHKELIIAANLN